MSDVCLYVCILHYYTDKQSKVTTQYKTLFTEIITKEELYKYGQLFNKIQEFKNLSIEEFKNLRI